MQGFYSRLLTSTIGGYAIALLILPLASQPWIVRFGFAKAYRDIALVFAVMAGLAALAAVFQRRAVMRKARSLA